MLHDRRHRPLYRAEPLHTTSDAHSRHCKEYASTHIRPTGYAALTTSLNPDLLQGIGPMARTGKDYLDMLKRRSAEIYIGGERVTDVTTHRAFANVSRTVARLYDVASDPTRQSE